jgi:RimJ/RimL family protein N-acetyltransferase
MHETSRLLLRRLTLSDTDNLYAILSDPEAMRFYPQTYSREETEGWITRTLASYAQHGHGFYACILKETGEFVGICGVLHQIVDDIEEKEVGYLFLRAFWRRGLATEAAAFWMNYAFTEMGRTRIISLIVPDNIPSRRVAEKNGLTIEKRTTFKEFVVDVWHRNKS